MYISIHNYTKTNDLMNSSKQSRYREDYASYVIATRTI